MNVHILKLIIISCLVFQTACGITFKRKNNSNTPYSQPNQKSISVNDKIEKSVKSGTLFSKKDAQLITSFYSDNANSIVRQDMIANTKVSSKNEKELIVNEVIPRDIQVIPLALNLEKSLSSLPLHVLRVHVGNYVILMNVKSRRILDIIKI